MQFGAYSMAGAARIAGVCLLSGALGGCYTMGGGGAPAAGVAAKPNPATPAPAPTPAQFTPVNGQIMAKAVMGSGSTDSVYARSTRMSVDATPGGQNVEGNISASPENAALRSAMFIITGGRPIASDAATIESNGSAVRGSVVGSQNSWLVLSNAPGSRLDASLGSTSLQHSFAGTGWRSEGVRALTGNDVSFTANGIFGGRGTSDMPTTGTANYAGGFEGVENAAVDASMRTSNISGKANLTANFAAREVRGRIDDVNNHSAGPVAQSAGYSIGYTGTITGSSFTGSSWLTRANNDAPLTGYGQNSGTLQGGFFGPGAVEATGGVSALVAEGNKKMLVTGAFGARKK